MLNLAERVAEHVTEHIAKCCRSSDLEVMEYVIGKLQVHWVNERTVFCRQKKYNDIAR